MKNQYTFAPPKPTPALPLENGSAAALDPARVTARQRLCEHANADAKADRSEEARTEDSADGGEDDIDITAGVAVAGGVDAVERRQRAVPMPFHGQRLDKFLVSMAAEFSRNHLQTLVEAGHVHLNGCAQTSTSRKVQAGQLVSIDLVPTQECRAFRPEAMALPIVFDKPAGWVVHPAAGNWSGTLLNGLLAHHAAAATLPRAGIVHRLDKDTSGLMVVGKTLQAVTALSRQIAARDVHRIYLAICHGRLAHPTQRNEAPIGRDPRSRVRMAVVPFGRTARTDVERLAVWLGDPAADAHRHADPVSDPDGGAPLTAVRCTLHTGRTHQIRVHLASVGHPLLGDATYGGRAGFGLSRQALHATQLGFDHPISGQPLRFDTPPPADFHTVWQRVFAAT